MTRQLNSLLEAAATFGAQAAAMNLTLSDGLKGVMVRIENTARASMGEYQPAAGGFPAWAPLAPATLAQKERAGQKTPNPLIATGEMLASFGHEVRGLEGVAGATDVKMIYHEAGTDRVPPRPVWGPAAFNNREAIMRMIGVAVVTGIAGGPADRLALREDGSDGYRYQIRV